MSEFTVVSTPEERLAAFLRDIGFDAGLVQRQSAVTVKLSGQGRFALVSGDGTSSNTWHVVATDFRQICVGAYTLWATLVGLGAYFGYVREDETPLTPAARLIWNHQWIKANRLANEFIAEGIEPGSMSKPTRRIFDWLLAEER